MMNTLYLKIIFCCITLFGLGGWQLAYAAEFRSGQIVGQLATKGSATSSALFNQQYLLLGVAQDGLLVVDISSPEQPRLISKLSTLQQVEAIVIKGKLAFIANGAGGLAIVDVSDPKQLQLLGQLDTSSYAFDLALTPDGHTAFIANNTQGVVVVDVSQAKKPRQLAVIPSAAASVGVALNTNGQTLYIAEQAGGIQVVDARDPSNPIHQAQFKPAGHPQRLIVSKDNRWLFAANNEGGLSIHALPNTNLPSAQVPIQNAFALSLASHGKTILVADLFNGLVAVDLTNPLKPSLLGRIKTRRAVQGISLSADQKTAYIADAQAGLTVIRFR